MERVFVNYKQEGPQSGLPTAKKIPNTITEAMLLLLEADTELAMAGKIADEEFDVSIELTKRVLSKETTGQ